MRAISEREGESEREREYSARRFIKLLANLPDFATTSPEKSLSIEKGKGEQG